MKIILTSAAQAQVGSQSNFEFLTILIVHSSRLTKILRKSLARAVNMRTWLSSDPTWSIYFKMNLIIYMSENLKFQTTIICFFESWAAAQAFIYHFSLTIFHFSALKKALADVICKAFLSSIVLLTLTANGVNCKLKSVDLKKSGRPHTPISSPVPPHFVLHIKFHFEPTMSRTYAGEVKLIFRAFDLEKSAKKHNGKVN